MQPEVELLQLALAHLELVLERRRNVVFKTLCDLLPHEFINLALDLILHCPDYQEQILKHVRIGHRVPFSLIVSIT